MKRYRTGVYLLGMWGVGALLLAAFPTDVPATPVSWHGLIHLVVAFFASVGGAMGTLALSTQLGYARSLRSAGRFATPIASIAVLFLVLLFGLPFVAPRFASNIGGVTERILIGSLLALDRVHLALLGQTLGFHRLTDPSTIARTSMP